MLKDWVEEVRHPSEEDLVIKRKVVVKLRGLPLNAWTETNIKEVVKDLGVWGWWVNRPNTSYKFENPRICLYTEIWDKIEKDLSVKIGKVTYSSKLVEVEHDHSKDSEVLEEAKTRSQELLKNQSVPHYKESREELVIRKEEIEDSEDEAQENSSSLVSRVSDSVEAERKSVSPPKRILGSDKVGELFWDFPESVDRKGNQIIQTGNLDRVSGSQKSICKLLQNIRLKGVGRPRKKRGNKNPFDMRLSKNLFKQNKEALNGNRGLPGIRKSLP